jgi:hypothetical protein
MTKKDFKIIYEFEENIRAMFEADDGRRFQEFGPEFWLWLDEEYSFKKFSRTGKLNRKQCKALWHWLGRDDPAPKWLRVYLWKPDVERVFPK